MGIFSSRDAQRKQELEKQVAKQILDKDIEGVKKTAKEMAKIDRKAGSGYHEIAEKHRKEWQRRAV